MPILTLYGTPQQQYVARDNVVYPTDGNGRTPMSTQRINLI